MNSIEYYPDNSSELIQESDNDVDDKIETEESLPEKSKITYNSCYNRFIKWKKKKGNEKLSEKLLIEYFTEMSELKKPSTLWSMYSMLKQTIMINDGFNIRQYKKLLSLLKKKSIGFQSKKSKSLTSEDFEKFLNEAPDWKYLSTKVALIFGVIGACRREDLCNIKINDIEDFGNYAVITVRNNENQTERPFTIVDEFYNIFKKYADLRPKNATTDRFFMNYLGGKCTQQVIGINKFGRVPKIVAAWLKLPDPDSYTSHTFRQTSAQLFADSGADINVLKQCVGINSRIAKCFLKDSMIKKKRICEKIIENIKLKPSTSNDNLSSTFETIFIPVKDECYDVSGDPLAEKEKSDECQIISEDPVSSPPAKLSEESSKTVKLIKSNDKFRKITPTSLNQQQEQQKTTGKIGIKPKPAPTTSPISQNVSSKSAHICLKWNSYHSNMQRCFPSLLDSEEFVDVTLACEGRSVKCHKVILSSCSDYLGELLRENPCQHPIILMKDLKFWEIEALVKFMYKGEVNVSREKLPDLLNAAKSLKIRGLDGFVPLEIKKNQIPISTNKSTASTKISPQKLEKSKEKNPSTSSTVQQEIKRPLKRCSEKNLPTFTKVRIQRINGPPSSSHSIIKLKPIKTPIITKISSLRRDNLTTNNDNDSGGQNSNQNDNEIDIKSEFHVDYDDNIQKLFLNSDFSKPPDPDNENSTEETNSK